MIERKSKKRKKCSFCGGKHDISKCNKKERYDIVEKNVQEKKIFEYLYFKLTGMDFPKNPKYFRSTKRFGFILDMVELLRKYGFYDDYENYVDFCLENFGKRDLYKWKEIEKNYYDFIDWKYRKMEWSGKQNCIDKFYVSKLKDEVYMPYIKEFMFDGMLKGKVHPFFVIYFYENSDIPTVKNFDLKKWKALYRIEDGKRFVENFLKKLNSGIFCDKNNKEISEDKTV